MEALYSKLYDKYTELKAKKGSELEQLNLNQEEKFKTYVSASDELIAYLSSEKDRLHAQISHLRKEMASIRSAKDEDQEKYEMMLLVENQKNKELLEEIERLQRNEYHSNTNNDIIAIEQVSGSLISSPEEKSMMRKRHRHENEVMVAINSDQHEDEAIHGESENALDKENICDGATYNENQPRCCGSSICMFQDLVECLLDLKFSIATQGDDRLITAVHESSGYAFSLVWVKNVGAGGEEELMYRVSSLGTLERVAPDWMRDVMLFSKGMCRIFFKRVSTIIRPDQ